MAPNLITVAVLTTLTIAGGSPLRPSKVTGNTENGLRGGRNLQGGHMGDGMYCSKIQCPERTTPAMHYGAADCGEECGASDCCEAKCSFHQCPERSTPVDDADEIVCPDLMCTDRLCCEAVCSYYQCPSGETLVADADDIVCPDLECSDGLCCKIPSNAVDSPETAPDTLATTTDSASMSITGTTAAAASTGSAGTTTDSTGSTGTTMDSTGAATYNMAAAADEDHHGDGIYCSNVQCPDRTTPSMYGAADCSGMCGESDCCEAKCSYHQCPQFSTPLDEADDIVCPELICTNDLCCEALCSYYQCPDGETLVEDADDIVCPDLQCSAELCCKIPTNTVGAAMTSPDSTTASTDSTAAYTDNTSTTDGAV